MRKLVLPLLLIASGFLASQPFWSWLDTRLQKPVQPPKTQTRVSAPSEPLAASQTPQRPGNDPALVVAVIPAALAAPTAVGPTWKRTRAQGVQLARMFVNEDSRSLRREAGGGTEGKLTIDHSLIAQVVWEQRRARPSFRGWLDVLKWLSPHVGKVKEPKRRRHDVSAHLPVKGNAPPEQWIDCRDVAEGEECDGDWRVHGPYWVDFREAVVDMWLTIDLEQQAKTLGVRPISWGNDEDVTRYLKNNPGHCALAMGERNFFVALPGNGCELNDPATVAAREGLRP